MSDYAALRGESAAPSAVVAPGPLELALVAVLYFLGAKLGQLTVMPEGIAIVWPPNAVVLAALLRFGGERLPLIGVIVIAAEIAAAVPAFTLTEALLFGMINFAEATAAFLLLRRLRFDRGFATPGDVWKFFLAGPIIAAGCASLAGAAVYSAFRGGETGYLEFARIWWFGDGLGLLVFTPLLLGFAPFRTMPPEDAPRLTRADVAVGVAALVALGAMWLQAVPLLWVLPLVLYVAARCPPRWAAAAVVAGALFVVIVMVAGRSPFGSLPAREAIVFSQRFILILALMGLGLAALLAHLRAEQALLERRVAERTAELELANARLAELAAVDALTGIANRRQLDTALAAEAARSRRYGRPLSLVLADLDHFKRINDTLGHAAGDAVIRRFADLLAGTARAADVVARYGGEEFAVLLPETAGEEARRLAERLRGATEAGVAASNGGMVTASFGVAELEVGDGPRELLAAADRALYEAKREGRNRVVLSAKS